MAAIKLTEWPPLFPQPLKETIALYFTLCVSRSPEAAERLATEVFTPTGCYYGSRSIYKGSKEIQNAQRDRHARVDYQEYNLKRAYSFDTSFTDIILLGQSNHRKNTHQMLNDLVYRVVFEDSTVQAPKIKLLYIWTDTRPLLPMLDSYTEAGKRVQEAYAKEKKNKCK